MSYKCFPVAPLAAYETRILAILISLLFLTIGCVAQGKASGNTQGENSSNSVSLRATSTVGQCINVEAVLLAKKPAAMLFGGFVADNYAVVKTTVSNKCDDEQFILHDIYFDYRRWALSGVYSGMGNTPCESSKTAANDNNVPAQNGDDKTSAADGKEPDGSGAAQNGLPADDDTTKGTCPGQVATVGALDVQDQDTEDAVWSPRNKVVKALTLVGQAASGYAFIWSGDAAKGIGAYNSSFVENVSKLWPDRRIEQEKNILSLGYRTDRSTAIAKDDHGSYFAFFPLKTFLSPSLNKIFLDSPAMFMNPAEVLIESEVANPANGGHVSKKSYNEVKGFAGLLLQLSGSTDSTQLLRDLDSECPGSACQYPQKSDEWKRVLGEKHVFKYASLNSVQIVVRGVMTVSVDSVPPTIDAVEFDNEKEGATLWTVNSASNQEKGGAAPAASASAPTQTAGNKQPATETNCPNSKSLTGTITGKFLSNGTPNVGTITIPDKSDIKQDQYIGPVQAVTAKASDTSLPFTMGLCDSLPNGSKLTFTVTRKLPVSGSDSDSSSPGSSKQTTSNKYVYTVSYDTSKASTTAVTPNISDIVMDNETKADVWQKAATLSGTITGTDLASGTLTVTSLEIGDKTTDSKPYIGTITAKSSTATQIDFELALLKPIPDGSKITFAVETKAGSATQTSKPFDYPVKKPAAKPAPKQTPKLTSKPKPTL